MKRKYLALGLSCALVATFTAVGTWAYLNDTTKEVTNTFTFCDEEDGVHLELKETVFGEDNYDKDGLNEGDPDKDDVIVDMVPGDKIPKNPMVEATNADCYLFVEVTAKNNMAHSGVSFYEYGIATGVPGYTWELVARTEDETDGCTKDGTNAYVLCSAGDPVKVDGTNAYSILADGIADDTVDTYADNGDTTLVKGSVTINTALNSEDLLRVENGVDPMPTLSFVAYAIQGENINSNEVEALFLSEF